jgi:hypothetical protein
METNGEVLGGSRVGYSWALDFGKYFVARVSRDAESHEPMTAFSQQLRIANDSAMKRALDYVIFVFKKSYNGDEQYLIKISAILNA